MRRPFDIHLTETDHHGRSDGLIRLITEEDAVDTPSFRIGSRLRARCFAAFQQRWIDNVMICEILPPEFARLYLKIAGESGRPETT
jgi:hypothetical protein